VFRAKDALVGMPIGPAIVLPVLAENAHPFDDQNQLFCSWLTDKTQKRVSQDNLDFADRHLSDEQSQMVRNAIYTALSAQQQAERDDGGARMFVEYNSTLPSYWDPPELTEDNDETTWLVSSGAEPDEEPLLALELEPA